MTAPADESLQQLLVLAIDVVEEASRTADRRPEALEIGTKANRNDLVTQVDRAIEDAVARRLLDETGLPLLGEEGHAVDSYAGRVWVLDPIDGTMNYVETRRDYAVSLALCEDGEPVLGVVADVARGDLYSAVRGGGAFLNGEPLPVVEADKGYRDGIIVTDLKEILALPRLARCLEESRGHRRYGSAALECVEIAAGRAGAFVHLWVSPWDVAAAAVICRECGARVTRLDGTPLDACHKGSILVGTPLAHKELLARLVTDPC